MSDQRPDRRSGFYYVTAIDGPRVALAFGPFVDDHAAAIADVERVRTAAEQANPWASFYAWGTCRCVDNRGPGTLGNPGAVRGRRRRGVTP